MDLARAAELAERGCNGGAENGCITLGVLRATGGAAGAPSAQEAFERGCTLGAAEACAAAGKAGEHLVPAVGLFLDPAKRGQPLETIEVGKPPARPAPGDGSAWSETCAEAQFEPDGRATLGIDKQALETWPASAADLQLAGPVGRVVARAVSGCVCPPGAGLTVALRFGEDGQVERLRSGGRADPACIEQRLAKADLPAPQGGTGMLWWKVTDYVPSRPVQAGDPVVVGGGQVVLDEAARRVAEARGCPVMAPPPTAPPPGKDEIDKFVKPREVVKGCAGKAIAAAYFKAGLLQPGDSGRLMLKFAVGRDGTVSRVEFLKPVQDRCDYLLITKRALQSCKFEPGLDDKGEPRLIWMVLPINFASG